MFGYVVVNQPEMTFRQFDIYRSYYCGFCRVLKQRYGRAGQLSLSYDMTFLIMLLSDLYDVKDEEGTYACIVHPLHRHPARTNVITEYAADMNVILAYYACRDDWEDEKKVSRLLYSKLLASKKNRAGIAYGKKAAFIKDRLDRLSEAEKAKETDIDKVSGYFGEIMGELFAIYDDAWEVTLRRIGFFLGKFIYIMDAYDDLFRDEKSGSYNPLLLCRDRKDFDEYVREILTMMMASCCEAFETLPLVEHAAVLRNILYAGVWTRYNKVFDERHPKEEEEIGKEQQ